MEVYAITQRNSKTQKRGNIAGTAGFTKYIPDFALRIDYQRNVLAVKNGSDRHGWWKCNKIDAINFCLPFFMNRYAP